MDEFIRSHIKAIQRTPDAAAPKPMQCMYVKKIAKRCVAAEAGLAAKDYLVSIDGMPAARQDILLYAKRAQKRHYIFYSRPRHEQVEMATTGVEIGVVVDLTTEAIRAQFNPKRGDPKALESIWEARDWVTLQDLSTRTLQAWGSDRDTPALMFLGAALYEQGHPEEGGALVKEYLEKYGSHWTMNFSAVGLFYFALDALRKGKRDWAIQNLKTAYDDFEPLSRIADTLEKETGERPMEKRPLWLDKAFPLDYELSALEGEKGSVSLSQTLQTMAPGKVFLVCLLASYRGNGPYNDFMRRYFNYATYFRPYVHGLHVITMEPQRKADRAHYYEAEDLVRAARLPMALLLDEGGGVTDALQPPGSPNILMLDHARQVRYQGELDSVEFWDTLSRMGA